MNKMADEAVVETPVEVAAPVVVVAEPVRKSFKEAEAEFNKQTGPPNPRIDVTKLRGYQAPITEKVPEVAPKKVEVAAEPTKIPETPEQKTARLSRNQRRFGRLEKAVQDLTEANSRQALELDRLRNPEKPQAKAEPAKEPDRKDYTTVEEWITAVRDFDRKRTEETLLDTKKRTEAADQDRAAETAIRNFNTRIVETRKKHDDWDEVTETTSVQFQPLLEGLLITADPEIFYEFAKNPKQATAINRLTENSAAAVGNSDDVTSMLRHLSVNPGLIDDLNELSPIKMAKFIGKLEVAIEAASKAEASKIAAPETLKANGPQKVEPAKANQPKPAEPQREPAPKAKPEPPPVLAGAPPKSGDWKSPEGMTLKERERLMMEDPNYNKHASRR